MGYRGDGDEGGGVFSLAVQAPHFTTTPANKIALNFPAQPVKQDVYSKHQFNHLEPSMSTILDRITIDPEIRSGKPVISGTRISVADILGYLAAGMSEQELLADFPDLVHDDILATLAFAAQREQRLFSVV